MVALLKMPMRIGPETGAERRIFPRKEIHVRVEGKRLDHSIVAHHSAAIEPGAVRSELRRIKRDLADAHNPR